MLLNFFSSLFGKNLFCFHLYVAGKSIQQDFPERERELHAQENSLVNDVVAKLSKAHTSMEKLHKAFPHNRKLISEFFQHSTTAKKAPLKSQNQQVNEQKVAR